MRRTTKSKTAKITPEEQLFRDQCSFNSGFHDAQQAVREGWATQARNFGFGPALKINSPEDVVKQHFSPLYAVGWYTGYVMATNGHYSQSSQQAWDTFTQAS